MSRIGGDEERSFVLYMKYFGIIESIRKHSDYIKRKQYYCDLYESNLLLDSKGAMDQTEKLNKSLKKRYEQLKMRTEYQKYHEETNTSYNEISIEPDTNYSKTSIDRQELFNMIQRQNILILDCRPQCDFLESRIKYKYCMNVPESICAKG